MILLKMTGNAVGPNSVITFVKTLFSFQANGAAFVFTDQFATSPVKGMYYSINFEQNYLLLIKPVLKSPWQILVF